MFIYLFIFYFQDALADRREILHSGQY